MITASGSGPDRSPVSSVPADIGDSGFEWRLEEGRFSLKPDGAGRSSFENWVAIPPGVIDPDADCSLRPSGVAGGFDIVIGIKGQWDINRGELCYLV